jgi:hypothetical protein
MWQKNSCKRQVSTILYESNLEEIPEWVINSHLDAWDKLNNDSFNALVSPDILKLVGYEATSFETFVQDYIDSLREEYLKYCTLYFFLS